MAFENVNVTNLRNSIITCKNLINFNTSENLITTISNNNAWNSGARDNLKRALDSLVEKNEDLKSILDSYVTIVSKIEQYKTLEEENKRLKGNYESLKNILYYDRSYTVEIIENGKKSTEVRTEKTLDTNIQSEMLRISRKIEENISKMKTLENEVSSLI